MKKTNLVLYACRKSKAYILLPGGLLLVVVSLGYYMDLREELLPHSVSVSKYTRKDGTIVGAHERRRPGGVAHDKPILAKISLLQVLITAGLAAATIPAYKAYLIYQSLYHNLVAPKETHETVNYAINNRLLIRFSYTDKHGETTERLLNPSIVNIQKGYTLGFCFYDKENRHFTMAKMRNIELQKPNLLHLLKLRIYN